MHDNIVRLSKKFIEVESIAEKPKELERILQIALSELGEYHIERFEKNGVKSALIYNFEERPKKFKVILNGHLDVVPGKPHQYHPKIENDRMYGVGALDMKSNAACLINVFKSVVHKINYPLGLQLVTDEELGGFNGTKHQVDKGVRADFVIAGETTNFDIAHKAKGILWLKILANGKTAHGAYPWNGKNAIVDMNAFLTRLEKVYPTPSKQKWVTTVNISRIETSNNSFNKIPDDCEVSLDIRFIPEDTENVVENIKKLLPENFTMTILANEPALQVNKANKYITLLKKIDESMNKKKIALYGAQGSSDARHFSRVGCDGIEFGPVGGGIGSENEWIQISSLKQYFRILEAFLLKL